MGRARRSRARTRRKAEAKKPSKKKASKKAPSPRQAPALEEAVPVVCSECYGDFLLSTKPSRDRITCPSCGHVGIVEEGIFEQIAQRQQNHRKNFIIACCVTVGAFLSVLLYGLLNSWPFAVTRTAEGSYTVTPGDENLNMVLLGLGLILLLGAFVVIPRYERSRVEVYF